MFYSHEILTSRKYGVATVWLVATLGAKSSSKKVTRKAILDVDVRKACKTIMQPEAPLALRLQSSLLYGVSRVYDQQCAYVLSDAQIAQVKIRDLFKVARNNELDPEAGKARPDQLILLDDPAFLPDMALPALDFDFANLEIEKSGNSQRSSQSMMSIRHRSGSVSSSYSASVLGLNIPSSSTHFGAYHLPVIDPFVESSAKKLFGGTGRGIFDDEEGNLYEDDMIFEFDANGEMRDIDIDEREARRGGSVHPSGQGRLGSDSAASGRVRKEHQDAIANRKLPARDDEGDFDLINFGDDIQMLPDAEPFPRMSGALGGNDKPDPLLDSEDHVFSEEPSSESAGAPIKLRKPKARKTLAMDQTIELRNNDLIRWQREYPTNMAENVLQKTRKKAGDQAKKNADFFVYGAGLNGVGEGVGSSKIPSPLAMFSGASLLSQLTGKAVPVKAKGNRGIKRTAPADTNAEQDSPTKRARRTAFFEDEVARGLFHDGDAGMVMMEDSSIGMEIGRDAPSALPDHPSSAIMPWNISASLHSHQRAASSSIQGRVGPGSHIAASISRRVTAASPLLGRGSNIPGELEHFSLLEDDHAMLYSRALKDDDDDNAILHHGASHGGGPLHPISSSQAEFEIFGAAAAVDTQTAASSQWVREALDRESGNFFEYVRNTISEKMPDELADDIDDDELAFGAAGFMDRDRYVSFEELFCPGENSRMVAAQAFYHVLSLATKGRVWVEQNGGEEEAFGEIRIGVKG